MDNKINIKEENFIRKLCSWLLCVDVHFLDNVDIENLKKFLIIILIVAAIKKKSIEFIIYTLIIVKLITYVCIAFKFIFEK